MCVGKICMMCTCLIIIVIAVGMVFGFGVFNKGFHKIHNELNYQHSPPPSRYSGRPFIAPPPF
uniref:uncharacterized protein LOC122602255 n=1 Tax=Erigeron canadensis TaxID=72917 RepID=UPI001CB94CBB|nr:uncharacterized protein LOC122602255 [Erigeron canadensis]